MSQENAESIAVANTGTESGRLVAGAAAGAISAIIGAMVWAAISLITQYELGIIAIGVGYGVAFGVRSVGQGRTTPFAITGAALALFGCVLGKLLTFVGVMAHELGLGIFQALAQFDYSQAPRLLSGSFDPMDLLFYAIAIYEGWRLSRVQD